MRGIYSKGVIVALALAVVGCFFDSATAYRFTSTSYVIDASVANNFGGSDSSTSYKLTGSGGESIVGQGSSGSYMLAGGYVAQLQDSLQLSVQPGGLKGYYPFEENSGTFTGDNSSYASNANLQTGATWTTGKVGNGVNTNASSYVQVEDSANLTFGQHMTVSLWANQASASSDKALIAHWNQVVSSSWALQTGSSSSVLRVFIANSPTDSGGNCVDTDSSWSSGAWHHVVLVYDGTQGVALDRVKVYIDGVARPMSVCLGTIPSTLQDSSSYLTIGAMRGLGRYFNGSLDEVKFFNRSFTPNEIKAEYDAGAAGNGAGLSFALGITPGISQTSNYDAVVLTDSINGYTLAVSQNNNLTKGADTINAVSGTIASPVTWVEGTTKGLGFTLYGTNATAIPGKWSSGAAYAAFPGTSTTFYVRTGQPSTKDVLNMRLRLDVDASQPTGTYTNVITTTGTMIP
ncbi:MAG TPA: LamG domain-containing protein [Candidatus Saccharimonas sp.]|mgnify:CR=1 FL=1|nr:LamG domain-containing protein [Candidatus Saccharimonas sp.]